jgi:type I restriction-modification system DNA methylase subunit
MTANVIAVQAAIRAYLNENDLRNLFIQGLLWHKPKGESIFLVGNSKIEKIATLRGLDIWVVSNDGKSDISTVEKEIAKLSTERLVINSDDKSHHWRWPEPRRGGAIRINSHAQQIRTAPEWLVQRLSSLRFEINTQQSLTVLDVREKMRNSFASEQITNQFFNEFKKMHSQLSGEDKEIGSIQGIREYSDRRWYSSVLLNRLMFLYFLEKKGFLDNDTNYLRTRLTRVQQEIGYDRFFGFYSKFLIPLFHDAIGAQKSLTDENLKRLIGDVPYLNGGVFAEHPLEKEYDIKVPDKIFEEIFDVFDSYKWHLDDTPGVEGNEINPDVLGHIFEKYVNQTETGAFYTPTDVTAWMSTSCVSNWIYEILSNLELNVTALIKQEPNRFLYQEKLVGSTMFKEVDPDLMLELDLPERSKVKDKWDQKCPEGIGLPSETIWEYRSRLFNIENTKNRIDGLANITSFDVATNNLDVSQICFEAIKKLDNSDLNVLWRSIRGIRVIDPTCGSGAFLIAVMDSLEFFTESIIARATELNAMGLKFDSELTDYIKKDSTTRATDVRRHMIVNNIYGADLAEEAVEIARLRMYLSLVSLARTRQELIPLPDLDFNLAAGNLLVGINTVDDLEKSIGTTLNSFIRMEEIHKSLEETREAIVKFQGALDTGITDLSLKVVATRKVLELTNILDTSLWSSLTGESKNFEVWKKESEPLHYLATFPEAMIKGGFDIVIGNPPFIKANDVFINYNPGPMICGQMPNIFAHCTERATQLLTKSGKMNFVLPYFFSWNSDYEPLRQYLMRQGSLLIGSFGSRPDALFRGVEVRISILQLNKSGPKEKVFTTEFQHWISAFRPALFSNLEYAELVGNPQANFLRLGNDLASRIFNKPNEVKALVGQFTSQSTTKFPIYIKKTGGYYLAPSLTKPRTLDVNGSEVDSNFNTLFFRNEIDQMAVFALLASRLAFLIWKVNSDDYNVTKWFLETLPFVQDETLKTKLSEVGRLIANEFLNDGNLSVWNPRAGKWMQTFDTSGTYQLSDKAVDILLESWSLTSLLGEFEAWFWRHMKSTGEAPGTRRGLNP